MKQFLTFICLTLATFAWSQLTPSHVKRLTYHVNNQVNKLRIAQSLPALKLNDTLSAAAAFHSQYMVRLGSLSHQQKEAKFKESADRVNHFGGNNFTSVGENILYTKTITFPLSEDSLVSIAKGIVLQWKNSPPHYKNILGGNYSHSGLGFALSKDNQIYATQVFAKNGYTVKNQLSDNAFNLKVGGANCDADFNKYLNIVYQFPHFIQRIGDEIYMHISDKYIFEKVISGKYDGLAIDLVKREQFECRIENRLDASPIYDGILLKPIYKEELFKENRAVGDIRMVTKVGEIPASLKNEDFHYSMLLIKNGKVCKYLHPSSVEIKKYDLQPFEPVLKTEEVEYKLKDFVIRTFVPFAFEVNKTFANEPLPSLEKFPIVQASIHAFSSVEGDSLKNVLLQDERAKFIESHLRKYSNTSYKTTIESKENWELFFYQLEAYDLFHEFPEDPSISQIRELVNSNSKRPLWMKMFQEQRTSYAIVDYKVDFESYSKLPLEILNLRDALSSKNTSRFNKALYDIYYNYPNDALLVLEPQMMEFAYQHPELIQNFMAVLSRVYKRDVLQSGRLVNHWLKNANLLDEKAIENTLHLYTLISNQLISEWDVDGYTVSLVSPPNVVKPLMDKSNNTKLKLNVHINLLHYYGHTGNYEGLDASYDFIFSHYSSLLDSADNHYNLARFSNNYSMLNDAINVLKSGYEKGVLDERGVLLLCQNMVLFQSDLDSKLFRQVVDECVRTNTKNWCYWLKSNIQNLRYPYLKERFCSVCN